MYTIAYFSTSTREMLDEDLQAILEVSRQENERIGITGLLVHCKGHFLQVIEGDQDVVEELFARISRDDRHHDVRQIGGATIDQRHFSTWSMGFKDVASFTLVDHLLEPLVQAGIIAPDVIAAAKLDRFAANS